MANYNTFIVIDCKSRKPILTTSSARKANRLLTTGYRVEVWNHNTLTNIIYSTKKERLIEYLHAEKEYIRKKQSEAEERNQNRRYKHGV